jgi:hypothetical protein
MLHSLWVPSSDPEEPLVRIKEDDREAEQSMTIEEVERLVAEVGKCIDSLYEFLHDTIRDFDSLPARLCDSESQWPRLREL